MERDYNNKRIHPPIYQHDYHVLTRLYLALANLAGKCFGNKRIVLDYGCGSAPYKKLFDQKAEKYIQVDLPGNSKADIIIKENEQIPLKNSSIDVVLSTQVLEHVYETNFYLNECKRLLKRYGLLIISTHGIWPYHPFPTDYHRWTRKGLEKILINTGYDIISVVSILGPFAAVTQYTLLLIADRLIKRGLIGKILLLVFSIIGNGIIFIEDKLFPASNISDAAVYVICARKK